MLTLTKKGLYCAAGDFYIDPKCAVDRAVVTHAHSDHARKGSRQYYCVKSGVGLLRARLGQHINVSQHGYRETFQIGNVRLSFHSAGHILGSCQVRLEYGGEVWVASGDYKREPDPTCEPFEPVECDVFVTEATFGTPAFRWPKGRDLGKEIFDWWTANSERGINSVLFAYSLGKTQRVLGALAPFAKKPIYCNPDARELNDCYAKQGIRLSETKCLRQVPKGQILRGELILTSHSLLKAELASNVGENYRTGFASGWMANRRHSYDKGFLMSDHADWDDLVQTIVESRARRVYVQHRGHGALVKHLRSLGVEAHCESKLAPADTVQLALF